MRKQYKYLARRLFKPLTSFSHRKDDRGSEATLEGKMRGGASHTSQPIAVEERDHNH